MRNMMIGAAILGLGVTAVLIGTSSDAAPQVKSITYDDATVSVNHGDFARLPDGGFRMNVCAEVRGIDGGLLPVASPCVQCEGGLAASTLNACRTEWRSVNGF